MKEIPILFSTPMVQAILDGRKRNTRRLKGFEEINENPNNWKPYVGDFFIDKKGRLNQKFFNKNGFSTHAQCPYGQPGDVLWVRETWCPLFGEFLHKQSGLPFMYKADVKEPYPGFEKIEMEKYGFTWKPSIHMPKAAARIWLQVEEIRVERLQDISEEDSMAEGVKTLPTIISPENTVILYYHYIKDKWGPSPIHSFQTLWQKINGKESWDLNPWVWVVKFKTLSTTGRPESINPSVIQ